LLPTVWYICIGSLIIISSLERCKKVHKREKVTANAADMMFNNRTMATGLMVLTRWFVIGASACVLLLVMLRVKE